MTHFKGLVDPKMKILSVFSFVPNPYEFTSEEHKMRKLDKLYWLPFSIFNRIKDKKPYKTSIMKVIHTIYALYLSVPVAQW